MAAAQPGPLKITVALAGSKPVPAIVKTNDCPATGGAGAVFMPVSCGAAPDTASVRLFEGVPLDPFCTVTVKLPPSKVAVPLSCVWLLLESAPFGMLQGVDAVQPGPLKITVALFRSKPVPVIVKVKDWPFAGAVGVVAIALS